MARQWEPLSGYACLVTLLLTLTYHSHLTLAGLDRVCTPDMGPVRLGLCGSNIPVVLDFVCVRFRNTQGVSKFMMKRSADQDENAVGESLRQIMLNKKDAYSFLPTKRQDITSRSIVCECCYHRCTWGELAQYCPLPDNGK